MSRTLIFALLWAAVWAVSVPAGSVHWVWAPSRARVCVTGKLSQKVLLDTSTVLIDEPYAETLVCDERSASLLASASTHSGCSSDLPVGNYFVFVSNCKGSEPLSVDVHVQCSTSDRWTYFYGALMVLSFITFSAHCLRYLIVFKWQREIAALAALLLSNFFGLALSTFLAGLFPDILTAIFTSIRSALVSGLILYFCLAQWRPGVYIAILQLLLGTFAWLWNLWLVPLLSISAVGLFFTHVYLMGVLLHHQRLGYFKLIASYAIIGIPLIFFLQMTMIAVCRRIVSLLPYFLLLIDLQIVIFLACIAFIHENAGESQ